MKSLLSRFDACPFRMLEDRPKVESDKGLRDVESGPESDEAAEGATLLRGKGKI